MSNFKKKIAQIGLGVFGLFVCLFIPVIEMISRRMETVPFTFSDKLFVAGLLIGFLALYSLAIWFALYRMSRPLRKIFAAIRPYKEGKEICFQSLNVQEAGDSDEFGKLAFTLNSLTTRIQGQIERLTRQKDETEAILESLREGVVAIGVDGMVTFANSSACQILGIAREKFVGESFATVKTHHASVLRKCEEILHLTKEKNETVSQTFLEEERQKTYLDLIAAPKEPQGSAILVLQDKTSDYKVIGMGKDFIANASHELRTPITIIRGFAEALLALPDLSSEKIQEITEKIFKTCLRLDSLVKSLLTLADVESINDTRFRHTNLVPLVENCKYLLVTAHPGAKVSFECNFPTIPIWADSDLIELAISNLLENAVKYSSRDAEIDISISCCSSFVTLSIVDQGLGIPQTDLTHIFDRFYTVDKARSRLFGGTGLGLSIVNTIIQKHKGTVSVSSELGKGSAFSIVLPLYFQKIEGTFSTL